MFLCVSLCLLIGFFAGIAILSSIDNWFLELNKPSFIPTYTLFASFSLFLYILIGVAAALVWVKGFYHVWVKTAMYHFLFQLLFNALWFLVFFGLQSPFWALLVIISLLILIALTIKWFKVVNITAAYLMIPYFIFILFTTVLNYKIWEMN